MSSTAIWKPICSLWIKRKREWNISYSLKGQILGVRSGRRWHVLGYCSYILNCIVLYWGRRSRQVRQAGGNQLVLSFLPFWIFIPDTTLRVSGLYCLHVSLCSVIGNLVQLLKYMLGFFICNFCQFIFDVHVCSFLFLLATTLS